MLSDNLFQGQPGVGDYYEWRDMRVLDKVVGMGKRVIVQLHDILIEFD